MQPVPGLWDRQPARGDAIAERFHQLEFIGALIARAHIRRWIAVLLPGAALHPSRGRLWEAGLILLPGEPGFFGCNADVFA
jgi:hypothetical protein